MVSKIYPQIVNHQPNKASFVDNCACYCDCVVVFFFFFFFFFFFKKKKGVHPKQKRISTQVYFFFLCSSKFFFEKKSRIFFSIHTTPFHGVFTITLLTTSSCGNMYAVYCSPSASILVMLTPFHPLLLLLSGKQYGSLLPTPGWEHRSETSPYPAYKSIEIETEMEKK